MCAATPTDWRYKKYRGKSPAEHFESGEQKSRPIKRSRTEDDMIDKPGSSGLRRISYSTHPDDPPSISSSDMSHYDAEHASTVASGVLSHTQKKFIQQYVLDFIDQKADITNFRDRIAGLSAAIQGPQNLVFTYTRQQHRLMHDTPRHATPSPRQSAAADPPGKEHYNLTAANTHLPPATLSLVDKYVSACRRRRSQTDGRRSVNTGPFRCTFGCGYRTKRAFDWRRHEETHEPQELWLCELCCQTDALNPFLVNRKDKFLRHAADKHTECDPENVLDMSKVAFVPRAAEGCPYCIMGDTAQGWSWDERCKHVLGHFEDEVERSLRGPVVISEGRRSGEEGGDRSSVDGSGVSPISEHRC